MLILVLSIGFGVWWLSYYLDSVTHLLSCIGEKTNYIESRLDGMRPMPHDVLRHIMQFVLEFDENRGGAKIWSDGMMSLKMQFLGGLWLRNMSENQIRAEWNTMMEAASVALTEGIFYDKSCIETPSNGTRVQWAQTQLNLKRPECSASLHSSNFLTLSPQSFAKQLLEVHQSRYQNLKIRESVRWAGLSDMPAQPKPLRDWVY